MKKLMLALCVFLFAAATPAAEDVLIGVTPFPHKDIMEVVKPLMAKDGFNLVIREFADYVQPNMALAEKQIFANFFQHIPYLDNMVMEKKLSLTWIAKVHIEPLGLYSRRISTLEELKEGAIVTIPNDSTNCARALRLLEANGLITLKLGDFVTIRDITANPRKIVIREVDAAQLPRTLQDATAAVINTNFAGDAGLIPSEDAIIIEGRDSLYANVVVIRQEDMNSPAAISLQKASQSPEVKAYIEKVLLPKGIIPAF